MDGQVRDMADRDYFALPAIDQSQLKLFLSNPADWGYDFLSAPQPATDAQKTGSAFHARVLGTAPVVHIDEGTTFARKDNKALREQTEADGGWALTYKDWRLVERMRDNLLLDPTARKLLDTGLKEAAITWTDPATGLPCKAKPDLIPAQEPFLVDLKSARSANPQTFAEEALTYGYHIQTVFYQTAVEMCDPASLGRTSLPYEGMVFMVCGKERSCDHGLYRIRLDSPAAQLAARQIRAAMHGIASMVHWGQKEGLGEGLVAGARYAYGMRGDGSRFQGHGLEHGIQDVVFNDHRLARLERDLDASWFAAA